MNPDLHKLRPYPFERLAALKSQAHYQGSAPHISLAIGEPQHPTPHFIAESLIAHAHGLGRYAATGGEPDLKQAICDWLGRRYGVPESWLDPARHVLPVNGTREGLFAFAQAVVDRGRNPVVAMPNPFYQLYEGAALLAGAEPLYLATPAANGYLPELDAVTPETWERCQLLYLCSPGNPTGALADAGLLDRLLVLADRHDFVVAADECYADIYPDEDHPPLGLLEHCVRRRRRDFRRCLVFHSLSKRSSAPGLRSGFVAGDADLLARFLSYRTYHGCAMALQVQAASAAAWRDALHVADNRERYRRKFEAVTEILAPVLPVTQPDAGFYLWVPTPMADTDFALELYRQQNVTVLPGSYLSRRVDGFDPGANYVRVALVPELEDCVEAALRIRRFLEPGAR